MKFLTRNQIFLTSLLVFSGIQTVHGSSGDDVVELSPLQIFEENMQGSLGDDENLKTNLEALIKNIDPAINDLNYEGVPLKGVLLNSKNQLGTYFEEVVKNAIRYRAVYDYEYEYQYVAPYTDILPFINPIDDQFKLEEGGLKIFFYDVQNRKASHLIFKIFFKILFFRSTYPDNKNSIDYRVLKHFLANLAIFAFDDRETLQDMIDSIRVLHSNKDLKFKQKANNIFEAFIDGAVRLYAYRMNERTDLWNNALWWQKARMKTMEFFKTPVSDNEIVFLAQQWNKIDSKACKDYLENVLPLSLAEYGFKNEQATKTSENIKFKSIGTWGQWLQKHKYKIIFGSAVVGLGLTILYIDKVQAEKVEREIEDMVREYRFQRLKEEIEKKSEKTRQYLEKIIRGR